MGACALAVQTREEEYLEAAGKYEKSELSEIAKAFGLLVREMEAAPFEDLLGQYYTDTSAKSTRDGRGEFYTPPCVSQIMAEVCFSAEEVIRKDLPLSVHEPAVGSGGMILQLARRLAPKEEGARSHVDLLRVTATDISPLACDMAYVNFTSWGIPAHVIHGNTLTLEHWADWKNIHWHRVGEDTRRGIERAIHLLREPPGEQVSGDHRPVTPEISKPSNDLTQSELDL